MQKKRPIKVTRKNSTPIRVYCLPEERQVIEANAASVGKSSSDFLRTIGQGYHASGVVDYEQVRELARINGDLGRLGGLLKLWLTNDERTARFSDATIKAVLAKIETTQDEMGRLMMSVVMPKAEQ